MCELLKKQILNAFRSGIVTEYKHSVESGFFPFSHPEME